MKGLLRRSDCLDWLKHHALDSVSRGRRFAAFFHQRQHRVFALDNPAAVEAGIHGVTVVLNCAGPFSHTWRPIADACLRTRAHYLDITGEAAVFEALAARDAQAKAAGVYRGRKPSIDLNKVREMKEKGLGATEIAKRLRIGRASVYRVLGQPSASVT